MCNCTSENLEIPRCATAHLRFASTTRPGMTAWRNESSALDERLLDHKMAGLIAGAFDKTAGFEHLAELFQHARAAAHHDAVAFDIERRLADVVEQLF